MHSLKCQIFSGKNSVKKIKIIFLTILFFLPQFTWSSDLIVFDNDGLFDDALALGLINNSPTKIKVLGVTQSAGSSTPPIGAQNILSLLEAQQMEKVPVYLGESWPLKNTCVKMKEFSETFGGVDWMGACRAEGEIPPLQKAKIFPQNEPASKFIVDVVKKNPNEVTLVAVGALTNIARALTDNPEIAPKIKKIIIMGGNSVFSGISNSCPHSASDSASKYTCGVAIGNASALAEFNFWYDPEAADIVLKSNIPEKILFTLDSTNQIQLDLKQITALVNVKSALSNYYKLRVFEFMKKYPNRKWNLWDVLPALYLVDSSIVSETEEVYGSVITQYGPAYGAFYAHPTDWGKPGSNSRKMLVVKTVNFSKFYSLLKKKIK